VLVLLLLLMLLLLLLLQLFVPVCRWNTPSTYLCTVVHFVKKKSKLKKNLQQRKIIFYDKWYFRLTLNPSSANGTHMCHGSESPTVLMAHIWAMIFFIKLHCWKGVFRHGIDGKPLSIIICITYERFNTSLYL